MKRLVLLLAALFSLEASAAGPCFWSGDFTTCAPASGIMLQDDQGVYLSPDTDDTHYVALKPASGGMSTNYAIRFPAVAPTSGQSMRLGGAADFEWYTPFSSAAFDAYKTALPMKFFASAASTANINMGAGNPGSIDGYDTTFGGTFLLKNQTDPTENGLWDLDFTGIWTRNQTMPDNMSSARGSIVVVVDGTVNKYTVWYSNADGSGDVPFVQIPTSASNAPLTASRALVTSASSYIEPSATTATELGYVSGVSSAIQTQLNAKQATITGAASTVVSSDLATDRAVVSNGSGKIAAATTTATEIGYVNGVSSSIQTQLNGKMTNPMTTIGDMIYGGASGVSTRLVGGTSGQLLMANTTAAPTWATTLTGLYTISAASLIFSDQNATLRQSTADAGDNGALYLAGGGAVAESRGAFVQVYGNEYTTTGGQAYVVAGSAATAAGSNKAVIFSASPSSGAATAEVGSITGAGAHIIGPSGGSQAHTIYGRATVDGGADAIQLTVQGHSTQTNDILLVEKSDGTDLAQVSNGGVLNLPVGGLKLPTSGGTPATLADYETGTLTYSNTTDWTVTKVITVYFVRVGNMVTLMQPDTITGTTNSASATMLDSANFPSRLRPAHQNECTCGGGVNNVTTVPASIRVRTSTVDLTNGIGGTNWTASAVTKTIYPWTMTYLLN